MLKLQKRVAIWIPVAVWLLQLQLLALVSLLRQSNTTFVQRFPSGLGLDYNTFLNGAAMLLGGKNPYSWTFFVSPPFVLIIGRAELFLQLSIKTVFFLNLALVMASMWILLRHFGVAGLRRWIFLIAVTAYYPCQFLAERGNLEGMMLLGLAIVVTSRRAWLRGFCIGLTANLKVYSLIVPGVWVLKQNAWIESTPYNYWQLISSLAPLGTAVLMAASLTYRPRSIPAADLA